MKKRRQHSRRPSRARSGDSGQAGKANKTRAIDKVIGGNTTPPVLPLNKSKERSELEAGSLRQRFMEHQHEFCLRKAAAAMLGMSVSNFDRLRESLKNGQQIHYLRAGGPKGRLWFWKPSLEKFLIEYGSS